MRGESLCCGAFLYEYLDEFENLNLLCADGNGKIFALPTLTISFSGALDILMLFLYHCATFILEINGIINNEDNIFSVQYSIPLPRCYCENMS